MPGPAWTFVAGVAAGIAALALGLTERWTFATAGAAVAVGLWIAARHWNRRHPQPFPYGLRWFLMLPRPFQTPTRLISLLALNGSERVLEVGPGVGTHALPVAKALSHGGRLYVLDVQPAMLTNVLHRSRARHMTTILAIQGNGAQLPFLEGTFDAAYMIGTLGEIPDGAAALADVSRVLKRGGRLVVGEIAVDPDFVGVDTLRALSGNARLSFQSRVGPRFGYWARLEKPTGDWEEQTGGGDQVGEAAQSGM